jgi:hypothetical protein
MAFIACCGITWLSNHFLLVLVRLLGAPPTPGGTHLEPNANGPRSSEPPEAGTVTSNLHHGENTGCGTIPGNIFPAGGAFCVFGVLCLVFILNEAFRNSALAH